MEEQERAPLTSQSDYSSSGNGNFIKKKDIDTFNIDDELYETNSDVSVYSDDDSAALFAEEDEASKVLEGESDEGDEDWMDDDVRQSSRLIYAVMTLLCLSMVIVTATTMYYSSNESNQEYEMAFADVAKDIIDVTTERSKNAANIVRSISRTVTTTTTVGSRSGAVWPFVTIENLEVLAEDFLAVGSSVELILAPLVLGEDRGSWEIYSVGMQDKVKNASFYQYRIPEFIYGRHLANATIYDDTTSDQFTPVWQMVPKPRDYVGTSRINYNLLSNTHLTPMVEASYSSKGLVQSQLGSEGRFFGQGSLAFPPGEKRHPQSLQVHPVFDSIQHEGSKVVAFIFATIPWDLYFQDIIIPESKSTVFCVIQDECADAGYTYFMKGGHVSYLGEGGLHLTEYESLSEQSILASYKIEGGGLDERKCQLTLTIYPSGAMHWYYSTGKSATHLLTLVIFVFILVCITIVTHHRVTDAYQRDTHARAQRSKAIIASLFPEAIREKLFDIEGEVNVDKLGLFNTEVQKAVANDKEKNNVENLWGKGDKYADLYEHCTVCIGDIIGFSGWASSRDPEEVFTLLEAVFAAFDRIAKSRGVYKVETAGDSYVAVAGLPTPRKDHAICIAKFARDALNEFIILSNKLEISLGPGTSELGVRWGLASGAVVAGVLRGSAARFQIYGDTVSKCSRIEQSGQSDRIHLAKETAELIKSGGQGTWVRPRQSENAFGETETYWLLPKRAIKSMGTSSAFMNSRSVTDFSTRSHLARNRRGSENMDTSFLLDSSRVSPRSSYSPRHLMMTIDDSLNRERSILSQSPRHRRRLLDSPDDGLGHMGNPTNHTSPLESSRRDSHPSRIYNRRGSLKEKPLNSKCAQNRRSDSLILDPTKDDLIESSHRSITRGRKRSSHFMIPEARKSQSTNEKVERLVFWNSQTLLQFLKLVVAERRACNIHSCATKSLATLENEIGETKVVLDLLRQPVLISDTSVDAKMVDAKGTNLGGNVESQLLQYVTTISSLFKATNPYSNFERASYTTMGMQKLLSRLVDPVGRKGHGLNGHPLIQFSLLLSTMISNVDHTGLADQNVRKQNACMSDPYDHQSIAEVNALDMAWRALMDPEFADLRHCIYTNEEELRVFRSVLFHSVLAADLTDIPRNKIIQERWKKAFVSLAPEEESDDEINNMANTKATAVMELLMQTAEVSHYMQHWHVYCKWSQQLFFEMYSAFQSGQTETDPSLDWYERELSYFDNQVIPLATKIQESGLLGTSGDRYLQNTIRNRDDWAEKGVVLMAAIGLE